MTLKFDKIIVNKENLIQYSDNQLNLKKKKIVKWG